MSRLLLKLRPYISGIVLLFVTAALGWYLRNDSTFFVVEKTPFSMEIPEGHTTVAAKLKPGLLDLLVPVQAQNIWRTDLKKLKADILESPWIKNVHLQRKFPDQVSVHVELEEVVFNSLNAKNWISVTKDGKTIRASAASSLPDRPMVRDSELLANPEKLSKFIDLYLQVPNRGALRRQNISEVQWLPTEGLTLFLLKEKVKVHLGVDKISTKGLQVLRVTDYLKSQKQKARVIDASFNKKVLVRLRKRS